MATTSATAWGRAQTGWLRFQAQGDATAQSPIGSWSGQARAVSQAYWEEQVTVNAPGLAGQPGLLTATIVINGALGLSGGDPYAGGPFANQSGAYFFIQAKWNGQDATFGESSAFSGGMQLRYVSGGGTATTAWNGNLIGPGVWQVTFPITFGQAGLLYVTTKTESDARAVVYGPGDGLRETQAIGDFSGGVRWAGITQVRMTNGTVVGNYTVTSPSGFDYGGGVATAAPPSVTQIAPAGGGVQVQWTDEIPRFYTVETTPVLPATSWNPVPGMTWPITNRTATIGVDLGTNAFFRVRAH